MLTVNQLHKRFADKTAVDVVGLSVGAGEAFCLLGANGAGKTTTMNMLLGFLRPDAGNAAFLRIEQRQKINDSWDRDKQADSSAFLQRHPQQADTSPITGRFAWHWCYAMLQISDEAEVAHRYGQAQSDLATHLRLLSPTLMPERGTGSSQRAHQGLSSSTSNKHGTGVNV